MRVDKLLATLRTQQETLERLADEQRILSETFPRCLTALHWGIKSMAETVDYAIKRIQALREELRETTE